MVEAMKSLQSQDAKVSVYITWESDHDWSQICQKLRLGDRHGVSRSIHAASFALSIFFLVERLAEQLMGAVPRWKGSMLHARG